MAWEGMDRRKFSRVMYPCMVKITISAGQSEAEILTHTENIGQGGLCIIIKKEIKLFTPVDMEVDLLDIERAHSSQRQGGLECSPQIRSKRSSPCFMSIGIEFTEMSKADHDHLQKNLQQLIKNGTELPNPLFKICPTLINENSRGLIILVS